MARVLLQGITKRYGDVTAVRGLDLEVRDREFLVLVGPSGCGKSTTLRMVAGLEPITEGDLLIGERRVNDTAPRDRDIAMVFQSYALYPHMTVFENMAFGLRLRRVDRAEIDRRVREAADVLDIGGYLDRKPKALSGGQRQRVAMGRAIVRKPAVFLFDEPLSNLDAKLRVQMRVELAQLHQRLRTTVLYVTHDQVEAMTLADRIAIMDEGELQQVGSPMEVYESPANRFVAGFIGSPGMNFLPCRVDAAGGGLRVQGDGFAVALPPDAAAAVADLGDPGRIVELGVRPEHVRLGAGQAGAFGATARVVEHLGADKLVHFEVGGRPAVARLEGESPVRRGDAVELVIDPARVHLFDGAGANALAPHHRARASQTEAA